jgi:predicted flavoprotein YhiN
LQNLCHLIGISDGLLFADLDNKLVNKLSEELTQANFTVNGKSTFKEEFVTCGGLEISEINLDSFENKKCLGLYFTGEVLNIDGITGGFNFQSCWSSAWVISERIMD